MRVRVWVLTLELGPKELRFRRLGSVARLSRFFKDLESKNYVRHVWRREFENYLSINGWDWPSGCENRNRNKRIGIRYYNHDFLKKSLDSFRSYDFCLFKIFFIDFLELKEVTTSTKPEDATDQGNYVFLFIKCLPWQKELPFHLNS